MYFAKIIPNTQLASTCSNSPEGCLGATYSGGGSLLLLATIFLCLTLGGVLLYKLLKKRK